MVIYYNDLLTEEAVLRVESPGFQFGFGVFETILLSEGCPCFVDLHYQRLIKSCAQLGLHTNLKEEEMIGKARQLSEQLNIPQGRLKVICFRDAGQDSIIMTLSPYKMEDMVREKGYALTISSIRRNPYSPLCYVKSLNYTENIIARDAAKMNGYDEALFTNIDNMICEGAVSNIFWVKGQNVFTPDIRSGILEGITRRQVIDICGNLGLKVEEGSFDLSELMSAEEVFLTNSLMGIMPVYKVEHKIYNILEYKTAKRIHESYNVLIKNHISMSKI